MVIKDELVEVSGWWYSLIIKRVLVGEGERDTISTNILMNVVVRWLRRAVGDSEVGR